MKFISISIIIKSPEHKVLKPGKHAVKYWMVSPAVILQKIVLDFGGENHVISGLLKQKLIR